MQGLHQPRDGTTVSARLGNAVTPPGRRRVQDTPAVLFPAWPSAGPAAGEEKLCQAVPALPCPNALSSHGARARQRYVPCQWWTRRRACKWNADGGVCVGTPPTRSRIPFFAVRPFDSSAPADPSDPTRLRRPTVHCECEARQTFTHANFASSGLSWPLRRRARLLAVKRPNAGAGGDPSAERMGVLMEDIHRFTLPSLTGPPRRAPDSHPSVRSVRVGRIRQGQSRIRLIADRRSDPTPASVATETKSLPPPHCLKIDRGRCN